MRWTMSGRTYRVVKTGDTTLPYKALFAEEEMVPFVAGEMQSIQMPHQQRILQAGFQLVQESERVYGDKDLLSKVRWVPGPLPDTLLHMKVSFFTMQSEQQNNVHQKVCSWAASPSACSNTAKYVSTIRLAGSIASIPFEYQPCSQ